MLIEVRRAMAEDISRVLKFYAERRYGGGIRPEDALLLAEHDGELIGIVRLTTERGRGCAARNAGSPELSTPGNREKTPGGFRPRAGWQRLFLHSVCASRRFLWRNRIPRDGTREGPDLSPAAAGEVSRPRRWERFSHHAPRRYPRSF